MATNLTWPPPCRSLHSMFDKCKSYFIFFFPFFRAKPAAKMEVKTSLLDNMIGVGDMVLLEPLSEDSFNENLRKRFDHNEIYVSNVFQCICFAYV